MTFIFDWFSDYLLSLSCVIESFDSYDSWLYRERYCL
jgi:hypothetical protein